MAGPAPVAPGGDLIAGIDIGGTSITVVLTDGDGQVRAESSQPTPEGGAAMARTAIRLVEDARSRLRTPRIIAAGVGAAGVVGPGGRIDAASDSFVDWVGFELGHVLSDALGVPVTVENDVNAFLLGELTWGAVQGASHALGIMLGTGVGGAIVAGGELYRGAHGAAAEIGHIPGFSDLVCTCGRRGHLETLASGRSIERRYLEQTGQCQHAQEIASSARQGGAIARQVFTDAGHAVGSAIITAATLFDLQEVVLGGGVTAAWDLLSGPLEETLEEHPLVTDRPVNVYRAHSGRYAVALGAAGAAQRELALTTVGA